MTKAKKATPERRKAKPHEILLRHTTQGAIGMEAWGDYVGAVDLSVLADGLSDHIAEINKGDLRRIESELYCQAVTLETVFTELLRGATKQDMLPQFESCMRLALKAQSQSRATLQALAEMKQPRNAAFVQQQNIAEQQVVNNGTLPDARTQENQIRSNELLEHAHGHALDTGAQSPTGRADSHLEAVGAVHGAKIGRGQGKVRAERRQGQEPPHAAGVGKGPAGTAGGVERPALSAAAPGGIGRGLGKGVYKLSGASGKVGPVA